MYEFVDFYIIWVEYNYFKIKNWFNLPKKPMVKTNYNIQKRFGFSPLVSSQKICFYAWNYSIDHRVIWLFMIRFKIFSWFYKNAVNKIIKLKNLLCKNF